MVSERQRRFELSMCQGIGRRQRQSEGAWRSNQTRDIRSRSSLVPFSLLHRASRPLNNNIVLPTDDDSACHTVTTVTAGQALYTTTTTTTSSSYPQRPFTVCYACFPSPLSVNALVEKTRSLVPHAIGTGHPECLYHSMPWLCPPDRVCLASQAFQLKTSKYPENGAVCDSGTSCLTST